MFAVFLNRNPVSSPSFVNAAATVPTRSLEADEAVRCSARSSIHLTGTPVLRLTAARRTMYEKTACLIPKLPPLLGGVMRRSRWPGTRNALAMSGWTTNGPWKFDHIVCAHRAGAAPKCFLRLRQRGGHVR